MQQLGHPFRKSSFAPQSHLTAIDCTAALLLIAIDPAVNNSPTCMWVRPNRATVGEKKWANYTPYEICRRMFWGKSRNRQVLSRPSLGRNNLPPIPSVGKT